MILEGPTWLQNEQRKFESFTEENFRDFSKACQQEVDWLKNYLRDIIARSKNLETRNSEVLRDDIGSVTISKEQVKVQHKTMNIQNSNIPRNSQKVVPKRLVKTKPEIKSLVRAAAIKKEQEHEKKTAAKEWETKRLAASQRRQEEQQKRLQIAKQREEEWKRKANLIPDPKKKEEEILKKKRIDQGLQKPLEIKKKKDVDLNQKKPAPHEKKVEQPKSSLNRKISLKTETLNMPNSGQPKLIDHGSILRNNQLTSSDIIEDSQSDYSEDDDSFEDVDKYKHIRPSWCQPHNIRAALIRQASIDPETIFGSIQQLDMNAIFKGYEHKFRNRSSSANWSGADALTSREKAEYKTYMGY